MKHEHGRKALEKYAKTGTYLFHGSSVADLDELEPRVTPSKAEGQAGEAWVQNTPVVSATENVDVAIFAATVWKRGVGTSGWYSNGSGRDAKFIFTATKGVIEVAVRPETVGYVYVLPKCGFSATVEIPAEFQSEQAAKPVAVVSVRATDLRPDVRTLKPDTRKH